MAKKKERGTIVKIKKTFWKNFQKFKVYLVDGSLIRKTVKEKDVEEKAEKSMADFLDYGVHAKGEAVHDEFGQIPKNEIWIANELSDNEKDMSLQIAEKHIEALENGKNDDDAYDEAMKFEKKLRDSQKANKHNKKRIFTKIKAEDEEVEAWIVDGEKTRDVFDNSYIQGGHHYVYKYVPKNEIWLDDTLDEDEFAPVLMHEYVERKLMKCCKMEYDDAHEIATKKEYLLRDKQK